MDESLWGRFFVIPGLLVPIIATTLLLGLDRSHWTDSDRFYGSVMNNRATSQLFVQVISHSLGAMNVHTLCSLFNFGTRLRLTQKPAALDLLKFWNAICMVRLDWSLPLRTLIPLIIFLLSTLAPGAIWAGALTPVINTYLPTSTRSSSSSIRVPQYSQSSKAPYWGGLNFLSPAIMTHNSKGTFSYAPNYDLQGFMLNQAASASIPGFKNDSIQRHAKIDNSQYVYRARSFGVGSSVGLVEEGPLSSSRILGYTYHEIGYETQIHCIKNESLDWKILKTDFNPRDGTYPNLYLARGVLANGAENRYAACGLDNDNRIVALVGEALNGRNIFEIAAGNDYAKLLNGTQCSVDFKPTNFSISVNNTERTIAVTPMPQESRVPDIEPSGKMISMAMRMPTSFSQHNACNLYTSVIGNTFQNNILNALGVHALNDSSKGQVLRAVEDSLISTLDNVLLAYSSAQLMIAHDTIMAPTVALIPSVRLGEPKYIYLIAALNFALLLLYLIEVARTRGWKGLQRFDYVDIKSVIVGTSMGGPSVANAARKAHGLDQTHWKGDAGDRTVGKLKVHLDYRDGEPALIHDQDKNGIRDSNSSGYEMIARAEEPSRNDETSSRRSLSVSSVSHTH